MTIFCIISKLWQDDKLPVVNGLLKADGAFYELKTNGLILSKPIDITQKNYNEEFSHINATVSLSHLGIDYYCGDGSHGSDGWILAMSNDKLEWLFFDYINPLEKLWIENEKIHAMSNLNVEWIFPINNPEKLRYIEHGFDYTKQA